VNLASMKTDRTTRSQSAVIGSQGVRKGAPSVAAASLAGSAANTVRWTGR
jgi:hypothetical protein